MHKHMYIYVYIHTYAVYILAAFGRIRSKLQLMLSKLQLMLPYRGDARMPQLGKKTDFFEERTLQFVHGPALAL
jgi:hypothetical protein